MPCCPELLLLEGRTGFLETGQRPTNSPHQPSRRSPGDPCQFKPHGLLLPTALAEHRWADVVLSGPHKAENTQQHMVKLYPAGSTPAKASSQPFQRHARGYFQTLKCVYTNCSSVWATCWLDLCAFFSHYALSGDMLCDKRVFGLCLWFWHITPKVLVISGVIRMPFCMLMRWLVAGDPG